jgi:hypothetical protein
MHKFYLKNITHVIRNVVFNRVVCQLKTIDLVTFEGADPTHDPMYNAVDGAANIRILDVFTHRDQEVCHMLMDQFLEVREDVLPHMSKPVGLHLDCIVLTNLSVDKPTLKIDEIDLLIISQSQFEAYMMCQHRPILRLKRIHNQFMSVTYN